MESLEAADRKIDGLADSGQLNPALLLTMAKAYSAAKDTNITKEEVKEIMGHLYFKARPECHTATRMHDSGSVPCCSLQGSLARIGVHGLECNLLHKHPSGTVPWKVCSL